MVKGVFECVVSTCTNKCMPCVHNFLNENDLVKVGYHVSISFRPYRHKLIEIDGRLQGRTFCKV